MNRVIEVEKVSKAFRLRHNRSNSLKSSFVGVFHKRYREEIETFWALRDITFAIEPGTTLGLIGKNGSGKSTLLKIIAGIHRPTQGEVRLPNGSRMGTMIELGVGFHPDLTGTENVYLGASLYGLSRCEIGRIYPSVVEFAELQHFMDVPVKNYSSGMYLRLGFALAANLFPDVLLIDEILAVGDEPFQKKCLKRIEEFRENGGTIVFVSHDLGLVERICDRACLLDSGRLLYVGKPAEAVSRYKEVLASSDELL